MSYSDDNIDYINNNMNLDLANINKWAETNKLILNTEKSRSILFSTSRRYSAHHLLCVHLNYLKVYIGSPSTNADLTLLAY